MWRNSLICLVLVSLYANAKPLPVNPLEKMMKTHMEELAKEQPHIAVQKKAPLSVGLVSYSGSEDARLDAESLQLYFESATHREIVARVFPDAQSLSKAIASGEIDLAWMQPLSFVSAQKLGKVQPLVKAVRHGFPFYRSVLFTKATAPQTKVAELAGQTVAWTTKTSAAGYLFGRLATLQNGGKKSGFYKQELFLGDHASVCKAVLDGTAAVGATFADDRAPSEPMIVDGCAQTLGKEAAQQLKIIAMSPPIPNDVIVVRPNFDAQESAVLKKMLLTMSKDVNGQIVLRAVFKAQDFTDVGENDFATVQFAQDDTK